MNSADLGLVVCGIVTVVWIVTLAALFRCRRQCRSLKQQLLPRPPAAPPPPPVRTDENVQDVLLRALPCGLALIDDAGRIRRQNPAFSRMTGHPAQTTTGTPINVIVPSPLTAQFLDQRAPLTDPEYQLPVRDGSILPTKLQLVPVKIADCAGLLILIDRTEAQTRQIQFANNLSALEFITDWAKAGYFRQDLSTGRVTGGKKLRELWGFSGEMPLSPEEWLCAADLPGYQEQRQALLDRKIPLMEYTYRSDYLPEIRHYRIKALLESLPDGKTGLFGMIQDISDIGSKERELSDANELIRSLFESLPCALFIKEITDDYRFRLCNPEFRSTFMLGDAEIVGRTGVELLPPDIAAKCRQSDLGANRTQGAFRSREIVHTATGDRILDIIKTAYNISGGRRMLAGAVIDVTMQEEAKRGSERRKEFLNHILDTLPAIVVVKDVANDFRYVLWNRAAEEFNGSPAANAIGKNDLELGTDPSIAAAFREEDEIAVRNGRFETIRRTRSAAGNFVDLQSCSVPFTLSDGSRLLLVIAQDVTRQSELTRERETLIAKLNTHIATETVINHCLRQLSTELDFEKSVQEMLRVVGENACADRCYIYDITPDGQLCSCHYEWVRHGHMPQKPQQQNLPVGDFSEWFSMLEQERVIRLPDVAHLPPRFAAYAGTLREQDIRALLAAGIFVNGKIVGFCGLDYIDKPNSYSENMLDVLFDLISIYRLSQERQRQIDEIAANNDNRKMILDMIPMPVMLINADATLVHANPAACRLAERDFADCAGRSCGEFFCGGTPDKVTNCPLRLTIEQRKPLSVEMERKGRKYILNTLPILNHGNVTQVLECCTDVTAIAKSKEMLALAAERAEEAARAKGMFLATMSHELRTPLNAVLGFAELLESGETNAAETARAVHAIKVAGTALLSLINDILDLSKLESGRMSVQTTPVALSVLLPEIFSIFEARLKEKNLESHVEIADDFPILALDCQHIRQILLNLLGNAVKFTMTGGVTLAARFRADTPESGALELDVTDTGIGIIEEDRERIFEPFVQGRLNAASAQGTGLGLPICRRLAQQMGGTLTLSSTPGCGSTFRLILPNIRVARLAEAQTAPSPRAELTHVSALIIDDVSLNRRLLQAMCTRLGVEADVASGAAEAFAKLEKHRPDWILTDYRMPEMNGDDIATQLRKNRATAAIKLALVTADVDQEHHFDRNLFDTVLLKPITLDKLEALFHSTPPPTEAV